jgi:hypothetical protein
MYIVYVCNVPLLADAADAREILIQGDDAHSMDRGSRCGFQRSPLHMLACYSMS